jgi:hypothetical protein
MEIWDCGDFINHEFFCDKTGFVETYWWKRDKTIGDPPNCDLCGKPLILRKVINEILPELSDKK